MCDQALIPAEGQGAGDLILQLLLVTGGVLLRPVLLASGLHCPQKTPGQSHGGWQLSVELVAGTESAPACGQGHPTASVPVVSTRVCLCVVANSRAVTGLQACAAHAWKGMRACS